MDSDELAGALEGILFGAGEAISLLRLVNALKKTTSEIEFAFEILKQDYASKARGIRLVEVEKTYQLSTKPDYYDYIQKIIGQSQKNTLSRAALETLSIVAYRQPITRHLIDELRGVSSDYSIRVLLERDLISVGGILDALGNPKLYITTPRFLRNFNLKDLDELPPIGD